MYINSYLNTYKFYILISDLTRQRNSRFNIRQQLETGFDFFVTRRSNVFKGKKANEIKTYCFLI